jgi:hypothetical protein
MLNHIRLNATWSGVAGSLGKLAGAALLLVIAIPPLRARAAPVLAPAANVYHRVLTQDRVNTYARYVSVQTRMSGTAPQDRDLRAVLHKLFPSRRELVVDPWGQRFYLRRGLNHFQIGSAGPDRRRGTRDDILSTRHAIVDRSTEPHTLVLE